MTERSAEHVHGNIPESNAGRLSEGMSLSEVAALLAHRWRLLVLGPLIAGAAALGVTYLIAPTFTAVTTFMPPQQSQSGTASALASLGALSGLAIGAAGVRSPAEQYVGLLQSVTVSDRLIEQFRLLDVYKAKFRVDARTALAQNVRISVGKKDGLITVEVDDESPQRAADLANRYVEELRRVTGTLAVTEAQQRRMFFERNLQDSRDRLVQAQKALESSGFNAGALKVEPRAAADAYARLRAEATAAEMRLGFLRSTLADGTPEIIQQQATLAALRDLLARAERASESSSNSDYVGKFREFKYQETLFDVYARQFELARADESREGALIQVVDLAQPPERKSRPNRAKIAGLAAVAGFLLLAGTLVASQMWSDAYRKQRIGCASARLKPAAGSCDEHGAPT